MEITADIVGQFRSRYPYFADTKNYPDDVVSLALAYSDDQTNSAGWGGYENIPLNLKQNGMFTWTANWLCVTYPDGADKPKNMNPYPDYAVSSKSVGDESISYAVDTPPMTDQFYMKTHWGQQFLGYKQRAAMVQGFIVV